MKKLFAFIMVLALAPWLLVGCTAGDVFEPEREINVVSREDGSGTRGAFTQLLGIISKGENGSRKDETTKEAVIVNQTGIMLANIAADKYAIGYSSLGGMNSGVKALLIDGVAASAASIKNGSYPITRPFSIATKGQPSGLAKDFIAYILSAQGQAVVAASYIPVLGGGASFSSSMPPGKIVVAGSSSVTPVMEKLKEAYLKINLNAHIEIQQGDSSTGMNAVAAGICDIGMASRDLTPGEKKLLVATTFALDGIVLIVNNKNPLFNLTKQQVKNIFTGKTTIWGEVLA